VLGTHGNLLPQKLQILITVRQTLLRRRELLREHRLSLGDGVREHDVRPEPEVYFVGVGGGDLRARIEGIV
jgi:hypothetical protein